MSIDLGDYNSSDLTAFIQQYECWLSCRATYITNAMDVGDMSECAGIEFIKQHLLVSILKMYLCLGVDCISEDKICDILTSIRRYKLKNKCSCSSDSQPSVNPTPKPVVNCTPPTIGITPNMQSVFESESIVLTPKVGINNDVICETSYIWTFKQSGNNNSIIVGYGETLNLTNVDRYSNGIYTVEATNCCGVDTASVILTVLIA